MSPVLFNFIIDELLTSLPKEGGLELDGVKLAVLAYADDVVLLAKSRRGGEDLLRMASKFFEKRGMELNGSKSTALVVEKEGKQKKLYASTRARYHIAGRAITTCE